MHILKHFRRTAEINMTLLKYSKSEICFILPSLLDMFVLQIFKQVLHVFAIITGSSTNIDWKLPKFAMDGNNMWEDFIVKFQKQQEIFFVRRSDTSASDALFIQIYISLQSRTRRQSERASLRSVCLVVHLWPLYTHPLTFIKIRGVGGGGLVNALFGQIGESDNAFRD